MHTVCIYMHTFKHTQACNVLIHAHKLIQVDKHMHGCTEEHSENREVYRKHVT